MSATLTPTAEPVVYPDSDGQPLADNTKQYEWIVALKAGLDALFRDRPDVFVAGDHLIYAKEGDPKVRTAPDVYVAFGRPKGHRGSYRVWEEGGVFPQAVFEVLSPGNRGPEMARKFQFYDRYGAEEYYIYDPDTNELTGWCRSADEMAEVAEINGWTSPRLGIRFDLSGPTLLIHRPDGGCFPTYQQIVDAADLTQQRVDRERARADAAEREVERMRTLLRQAGIDPDAAGT